MGLKVLMISRASLFTDPGGDSVQVKSTAKYLRERGLEVDIELAGNKQIDYSKYDILHFFNLIRPNDFLYHAQKARKPFVLSTIYVDYREYEKKARKGPAALLGRIFSPFTVEYLKTIARAVLTGEKVVSRDYFWMGQRGAMNWLLRNAALLLPNSGSEMERVFRDLGTRNHYMVVPNAIDPTVFRESAGIKRDKVICVARIEGRKNQLNLIKAMDGLDFDLFIIGKASPNHRKYLEVCQDAAGPRVHFIHQLPQAELVDYYQSAKVHVLASWFETTGLSSLEAGYLGCNLVITDRGDTREYFEDYAFYCEPDNPLSIRNAIVKAAAAPYPHALKEKIAHKYNWQEAARITHEAYTTALQNRPT